MGFVLVVCFNCYFYTYYVLLSLYYVSPDDNTDTDTDTNTYYYHYH